MKLRKITLTNYRSFKEQQTFQIDGDISIIIGPNGGGKSNLLDVTLLLLRKHVFTSWLIDEPDSPNSHPSRIYHNDSDSSTYLQKHFGSVRDEQFAEIVLEVTDQDIDSMKNIIDHEIRLRDILSNNYTGVAFPDIEQWKEHMPFSGQEITIAIYPNFATKQSEPKAAAFLEYLGNFEWIARLRSQLDSDALPTPILSLPANRSANGLAFDVGLAGWQESNYKRNVDLSNSRTTTNIVQLAIGRLANRFNDILHTSQGNAEEKFLETEEALGLTSSLEPLGYKWSLKCKNRKNNDYTIELTKGTTTFSVNEASSGEKEILVLLFAIFGLNVRQAIIIIDEPELHLHPRLQKKIFQLFEHLSKTTCNQFILATHSATFVSPTSIQYVSRVYNEHSESKIIRLNDTSLPNAKHLFNIINSQNNESLFFADHVLLVEGLSDKIFFEKIIELFSDKLSYRSSLEIVPVGGKGLFKSYELVLKACKVPYSILADQDYLEQVGSHQIKQILSLDPSSIKKHVINDPTSRDGATLIANIEQAINSGNWEHAASTWEYIKSRHTRIHSAITTDQLQCIKDFIEERRTHGIYILSRGALEAYLPAGHLSKDIEKLITLLETENFWLTLPKNEKDELTVIINHLLTQRIPSFM